MDTLVYCLCPCSNAVKGYYDHGNSYKGKYVTGACLQFQSLSLLS